MNHGQPRPQEAQISSRNFGLLIAYVIPGFLVVAAAGGYSPTVEAWLGISLRDAPTVAGFLYTSLASVAAGMVVSALRWLVVDTIHHYTGVPKPAWDMARLSANLGAFEAFVEYHYRYYQHYANMLTALAIVAVLQRNLLLPLTVPPRPATMLGGVLVVILFLASRDALRNYYARTGDLLNWTGQMDETADHSKPTEPRNSVSRRP